MFVELIGLCGLVNSLCLGTDFSVKKVVLTLRLPTAITLIVLDRQIRALLSLSVLGLLLLLLARLTLLQRVPEMRLHH